jgi:kynurenine formamidase
MPFEAEVLFMSSHTGTHVDAPSHFVPGGSTVERYPVRRFIITARVWDFHGMGPRAAISGRDLQHAAAKGPVARGQGVLIRTDWAKRQRTPHYLHDYPALNQSAGAYLVRKGVGLVGVDSPNIDQEMDVGFPVHTTLLKRGIAVVENLANLDQLPSAAFRLIALPLRLRGATGSPIRAIALLE